MVPYITLYHGSSRKTKPRIQRDKSFFDLPYPNRYDALCATQDKRYALIYGEYVHSYRIYKGEIASNQDLLCDKAQQVIREQLKLDDDDLVEKLTFHIATQTNIHETFPYIFPKYRDDDDNDDYISEVWRLRGRIAYELGFRVVSYYDKDGWVSYLIVR